jgi:hypothetical protein
VWLWLWRWLGGSNFFFFVIWRWLGVSGVVVALVAWGVAVAGWQWDQSIEEISAVRMVPDTLCGCGCGGGWVAVKIFFIFFCKFFGGRRQWV